MGSKSLVCLHPASVASGSSCGPFPVVENGQSFLYTFSVVIVSSVFSCDDSFVFAQGSELAYWAGLSPFIQPNGC